MGCTGKGTVYIPLVDFWEFVRKYQPDIERLGAEVRYGEPRMSAGDLEFDFTFSTEGNPDPVPPPTPPLPTMHTGKVLDCNVFKDHKPGTHLRITVGTPEGVPNAQKEFGIDFQKEFGIDFFTGRVEQNVEILERDGRKVLLIPEAK